MTEGSANPEPGAVEAGSAIALVGAYQRNRDTDLILYSGDIFDAELANFSEWLQSPKVQRRSNLTLFLTTYGGDAHAAFRAGRLMQRRYKSVRILIAGPCKSAGTLLALSAHELAFGSRGELGPLDVQIAAPDELRVKRTSGLDTLEAFGAVQARMFAAFEFFMLQILDRSSGSLSTKMACELASGLSSSLCSPLAAQIDPHRLGEVERYLAIAEAYGTRLVERSKNLNEASLRHLVHGYPSHEFAIDLDEATNLFAQAKPFDSDEEAFSSALAPLLRTPQSPCTLLNFDEFVEEESSDDSRTAESKAASDLKEPEALAEDSGRGSLRIAGAPE